MPLKSLKVASVVSPHPTHGNCGQLVSRVMEPGAFPPDDPPPLIVSAAKLIIVARGLFACAVCLLFKSETNNS